MKHTPRLSAQGVNLYNKANQNELTQREAEELHFEFLTIIRALQKHLKSTFYSSKKVDWFIDFPKYKECNLLFNYAIGTTVKDTCPFKIRLSFKVSGDSEIEFDLQSSMGVDKTNAILFDFRKSASYKRYFAHHDGQVAHLGQFKTILSRRQVTSKHLFDYLIHLCEQFSNPVKNSMDLVLSRAA